MALDPVTGAAAGAVAPPVHEPAGDFTKAMEQAAMPSPPTADPARIQALQPTRTDSLGHQLLDSLERFSGRMQELQKLGTKPVRGTPGLPSGPAALLTPVGNTSSPKGAPKLDPADEKFDRLGAQYDAIFDDSMARQAKLFGLVVEVDLGRSIASTSTSTAKTLLTQSG